MEKISGRQLAFQALEYQRTQKITLEQAFTKFEADSRIVPFAKEIAYGTLRRSLELMAYLKQLNDYKSLRVKSGLKVLLQMALYQFLFMDRVALHGLVNETVELAKKVSKQQAPFVNAILRKLDKVTWDQEALTVSQRYSLPPFVLEKLPQDEKLFKALLARPQIFVRSAIAIKNSTYHETFSFCQVHRIDPALSPLKEILKMPQTYIQNITPVRLMAHLMQSSSFRPQTILDMCASPGGKISCAHLIYPEAKLFANDSDASRMERLKENLERLEVSATLSNIDGTKWQSSQKFDLIILDLPCTNSGVFAKKPEAKYRLNQEEWERLQILQHQLIQKAAMHLNEQGQLWVMTCSIFAQENDALLECAQETCSLRLMSQPLTLLPNLEGQDGGFGAAFQKKSD